MAQSSDHDTAHRAAATTVIDPVCGMDVTPGEAEGGSAEHAGTTYWFCNPSCRERFVADPAKFLEPAPAAPPAGGHGDTRIYTCPMHPEVRQVGPGACPKCGMALEPVERRRRGGPESRADRHDPAVLGEPDPHRARLGPVRWARWSRPPSPGGSTRTAALLDPIRAGDAGGALGRLALLRARLAVDRHAAPEHVHADRARHRRGVRLQRVRRPGPGRSSRIAMRHGGAPPVVLRGRGGHHDARPARPGARAARAQRDVGAPSARCWGSRRRRRAASATTAREEDVPLDRRPARRSPARASRREGAGRRRGAGGPERGRRVDGHGRADPRREGAGRAASSAAPSTARAAS